MAIKIEFEHQTVDVSDKEDLDYNLGYYQKDGWECCGIFNSLGDGCYVMIMKRRIS